MKRYILLPLMLGIVPMALADYRMTPREAVYYWASKGNVKNLNALKKSGYSLDMPDARGKQAVCEAVEKNDVKAFKTLKKAGANMNVFCLYNMSQEKRYEFNQAYYGLPLVVPVMGKKMLEEDDIQSMVPVNVQVEEASLSVNDSTQSVAEPSAIVEETESFEVQEEKDLDQEDRSGSVVFKPYIAANLFYGKGKADVEASAFGKRSSHVSDGIPGLALAFGAKISDFRAEFAVQGHTKLSDNVFDGYVKSKTQTYAGFLNAYYDIQTGTKLTPYIGAGIGLAHNKSSLSDDVLKYSNSNWSFAWQLAAGLNYPLTDSLVADLGYRYTDYGKVNIVNENGVKYRVNDIQVHNVTLGLRYEM